MSWIQKQWDAEYITLAETKVCETMLEYRKRAGLQGPTAMAEPRVGTGEMPRYMSFARQYGYNDNDDMDIGGSNETKQTVEQEYHAYVTSPLSSKQTDILKFWEFNGDTFPTIFAMAMDYLPIQASAVPCERVFFSGAETDTKQRNHIHPDLMEALQMQKFLLKKERLNFMDAWITAEKEMIEDDPDYDLLQTLLEGDHEDKLDLVMQSMDRNDN